MENGCILDWYETREVFTILEIALDRRKSCGYEALVSAVLRSEKNSTRISDGLRMGAIGVGVITTIPMLGEYGESGTRYRKTLDVAAFPFREHQPTPCLKQTRATVIRPGFDTR